jgi:hypothetical protein
MCGWLPLQQPCIPFTFNHIFLPLSLHCLPFLFLTSFVEAFAGNRQAKAHEICSSTLTSYDGLASYSSEGTLQIPCSFTMDAPFFPSQVWTVSSIANQPTWAVLYIFIYKKMTL